MAETAPLYDTYMRAPLRFERGEGVWLITESGERYLDFGAGVAVSSLGHGHPHLVQSLKDQADKVQPDDKERMDAALKELKDALAGTDIEAVKRGHENLVE